MGAHTDLSIVAVSAAPSPAISGTTLGVTDANAAYLPNVYPWWALVKPTNAKPTRANSEIVQVTAGSSSAGITTYTIVRAQGLPVTTARSIIVGDEIMEVHSAQKQIDTETGNITASGTLINGATEKTTPVDADMVGLMDSAASNILKKLSWANIKATLKTYFDSLSTTLTNKTLTSPVINTQVSGTAIAAGTDVATGTSNTLIVTPLAVANSNKITARSENTSYRRYEKNIQRKTVTTAATYLKVTCGSGTGQYMTAYVDVLVGGINNGLSESGSHARYWVRCNNTTVTIAQIGSTENSGSGGEVVLSSSVSSFDAIFQVAKNASASSADIQIATEVTLLTGTGSAANIAYA